MEKLNFELTGYDSVGWQDGITLLKSTNLNTADAALEQILGNTADPSTGYIPKIVDKVNELTTDVSLVDTKITKVESDIAQDKNNLGETNKNLTTLNNEVANLKKEVATVKATTNSTATSLETLDIVVEELKNVVGELSDGDFTNILTKEDELILVCGDATTDLDPA